MPLILSLIINRENQVLFCPDYQVQIANLLQNQVHPKLLDYDSRRIIKDARFNIYCLNENSIFYFVVSDPEVPERINWLFLKELKTEYEKYSADPGVMKNLMQDKLDYMNNPHNDSILQLKSRIEDTKQEMILNIEKVIDRGEKLEEIELESKNLAFESSKFEKQTNKVRWSSVVYCLIATAIFLFLAGVLSFFIVVLPFCIIAKKC